MEVFGEGNGRIILDFRPVETDKTE